MDNQETDTSTPDEQRDGGDEVCEYCGAPVDTSDWHPVSKQRDSDGSLQLILFCSEDCQEAWQDEHED